jgi:4-alpha-glucanotransferase
MVGLLVRRSVNDLIIPCYRDAWGKQRRVPDSTLRAIRAALGTDRADFEVPTAATPCGYMPERRMWGISVQLYGLRSARNWGIGDFSDLARMARLAARLGADAVGINPVHAQFPGDPRRFSPYGPSDRRFLDIAYIDVEAIEGFEPPMRPALEAARAAELVDYAAVSAAKRPVLERLYQTFRARGGSEAFRSFTVERGDMLRKFATFEALSEHFGAARTWRSWPIELQDAHGAAVDAFAAQHPERIEFFAWLQFVADAQLAAAARAAKDAGMQIGLYHDLALGADADGAEAWVNRRLMADGMRIGAPPDDWNQLGQNWGLPAYNPIALREAGYAPFTAVLHAAMRHAGALRIDHAMSLERLYWIPEGAQPDDGGYVRYPVGDLIALVARESAARRCVVIGEDLGTLPEGFDRRMRDAAILSYRLLYFSQTPDGEFLSPGEYPAEALVAASTHDLATLPGFFHGHDLDVRHALGLFASPDAEADARARREREFAALRRAFEREGIVHDDIVEAAYRFLARTPSRLLLMQIEDVLGMEEQANLPGTTTEHPNWRRKLSADLDALETHPRLAAIAATIAGERPKP